MTTVYIHAESEDDKNTDFSGMEIVAKDKIDGLLGGYEYGDVAEGRYQIWEYPSGKMYEVVAETYVNMEPDYYSGPNPKKWIPKLKYFKTDKKTVVAAYDRLTNLPESPSLWQRVFRR